MIKIIGIAFIGVICFVLIKSTKPDLAPLLLISVGAVILILLSDSISNAIGVFLNLSEEAGLTKSVFSALIKIIGIAYLTEYSVNISDDLGCSSIGKKIEIAGKITIFTMAIPIITEIIKIINGLL